MRQSCPTCGTPAVAGYRFCGSCGALLRTEEPRDREPAVPVTPQPPIVQPAQSVVDGLPDLVDTGRRDRIPRVLFAVASTLLVLAVSRVWVPGGDGGDGFLAASPGSSGSQSVDVPGPALGGGVLWTSEQGAGPDWVTPLPWAAPVVTRDTVVAVVPGAIVFAGRDAARPTLHRAEVPVTASSALALVADRPAEVAAVARGAVWWASASGPLARTPAAAASLADVSPLTVGDAVLVQSRLGGLHLFRRDADRAVEVASVRGLDIADDPNDVPSFRLAVRDADEAGIWVGARGRQDNQWSLWQLAREDLTPLGRIRLGTTEVPTMAATGTGAVMVAVGETVQRIEPDGTVAWSAVLGPGAEVLGTSSGLVSTRHRVGHATFNMADGRVVSLGDHNDVQGPRSVAVADEILVNGPDGLVALDITHSNTMRPIDGPPLSIAGQDELGIAHIARSATGDIVLRLTATPARTDEPIDGGVRDLPVATAPSCRVAGVDDRVVWHDGARLRALRLDDGTAAREVVAGSSRGSALAVAEGVLHVVDERGFVRMFTADLDDVGVLPIGDDAAPGVAVSGDLVVGAGGTGAVASLSAFGGFVRGIGPDGGSRWLSRVDAPVAGPPVTRGERVAIRDVAGSVILFDGPDPLRRVPASPRTLDAPVLDDRGSILRDGDDLVALHTHGAEAWRAEGLRSLAGMALVDDLVVVRTVDEVVALDRDTGDVRWRTGTFARPGTPATALSLLAVRERVVVVMPERLVELELDSGRERAVVDGLPGLQGAVVATSIGLAVCTTSDQVVLVG